jgi:hypothetical protein
MTHALNAAYAHRQNRDGSVDSICKTCFATVAQVQDEVTLTQLERTHCCPAWILAGRGNLRPAVSITALTLVPPPIPKTRTNVV